MLLFLVALDWHIRAPDSRSRQLTSAIEAPGNAWLNSYPYHYRVLHVGGQTAFVSTPGDFPVPAFKALAVPNPEIDTMNASDPAFITAQTLLGEVQSEARTNVRAQPGISDVRRQLDREWLAAHHRKVPDRQCSCRDALAAGDIATLGEACRRTRHRAVRLPHR